MSGANRILVVDDESVIRDLLTDILSDDGFTVEAVSNGLRALEVLEEKGDFAILLTDIMMPEMDGIQLVCEARKRHPSLIPIVMTGFATLETARAAVREGAYDYVLKPFSLTEVKLAVNNALDRSRLSNENTRLLELTELFNVSERIAAMREEQGLLDFVLRAALDRVEADRGSIMVITPDGSALEVAASVNVPDEAIRTIVMMGTGISGHVAQSRQPLLVEDIRQTPDVARISRRLHDASFISVPLERKGPSGRKGLATRPAPKVLAVLNVNEKRNGRRFTESDLKVLRIMANQAAAALQNVRLIQDIEGAHVATLQSMALLLEAKDAYTHGHSERVRDLSVLAAREMDMSEHDINVLSLGAALHDIGKVGVNDAVLNKVEKLNEEEWDMIRRHPLIGYDVLAPVPVLSQDHLQLVRSHHERVDGQGYPDRIEGADVAPLVRIIVVADAYDAMSSSRAYRSAMPPERIIEELKKFAGSQFDIKTAKIFIELIRSGKI